VNLDRLQRSPNIAIVGSTSPAGKELKDLIQESGLAIGKVKLIDTEEYAGLLQEFAGQIQITQVISPTAFDNIDIAFFACSPEIMRAYAASGPALPDVSIDLTQTGREGTLFLNGLTSLGLLSPIRSAAYFVSPHPAVIAVARVIAGLQRRFSVESVSVTIMEPASERGLAAIDELQEQTVRLLNFQPAESKLFKGQIAFNLLPETDSALVTERLIRDQLAAILGADMPSLHLMMVQAPVFHSEAFSMFVQFSGSAAAPTLEEVRSCLTDARGGVTVADNPEEAPSPVSVVGSDKVHVGRISQDPVTPASYGMWITADNLRIAASNALGIAESIMLSAAAPR